VKHWPRRGGWAWLLAALWLLTAGNPTRAQVPAWQAAIAGSGVSGVNALTTDAAGNVYLAGFFAGSVSFGPVLLSSTGGSDLFVAKWTPAAGFVWALQGGGNEEDNAWAIAVQGSSVYITGTFSSHFLDIGNTRLTNVGPTIAPITTDVFVAKLTDAGTSATFDWAEQAGGTGYDVAHAIAVRGTDVYVAGEFRGPSATFGASGPTLPGAGTGLSCDGYVAKLTDGGPLGVFLWAQRLGGTGYDYCNALVANSNGLYVGGTYNSGSLQVGTTRLNNQGGDDAYVTRLTDNGTTASFAWAQALGGPGDNRAEALAVNGSRLYLAGSFNGSTMRAGGSTLYNAGTSTTFDAYVVALTDVGNTAIVAWGEQAGGPQDDYAAAIIVRGNSVYLAGNFQSSTAYFGSTMLTNVTTTSVQGYWYSDVFVARLVDAATTGTFAWARQAGGPRTDWAQAVAVAGTAVYVGGTVAGPVSFGSVALPLPVQEPIGFLASLADPLGLATHGTAVLAVLRVAPNPARTATTVQLPRVPGVATATLTLYDGLGRVVHTTRVALAPAGATAELPLHQLAPGPYHLLVQAGNEQASRTLLVE
jgi:hypothetical protein